LSSVPLAVGAAAQNTKQMAMAAKLSTASLVSLFLRLKHDISLTSISEY
jgi:hypothetical protein